MEISGCKTNTRNNQSQKVYPGLYCNIFGDVKKKHWKTKLLAEIVAHLLPQPIYQNQLDYLKTKLLANTTEAQWTASWNNYKANPNNAAARTVIETRLKPMFLSLLAMPEYYLS